MATFFGNLRHGFDSLPLLGKIIIGGVGLVVLLVGTIIMVFTVAAVRYERTDETPLVRVNCGPDSLTINGVARRFVGGSSTGHRLYWNGRAVARRAGAEGAGQPNSDEPVDPDDRTTLLIRQPPQPADPRAWTVWVSPDDFSRAEFDALAACLHQNQAEINRQLAVEPDRKPDESYHPLLGTDLGIGTVIYGRADAGKPRLYTWATPWGDAYTLSIDPGGRVELRQDYQTMELGQVSIKNDQRVLTWHYTEEMTVLGRDLPNFKNDRGEPLTARYQLRHMMNDAQVFFRQTATHYEQLYVQATPDAGDADSLTVNALTVDLSSPVLRRNYVAGKVRPDSTGRSRPVFRWRTWPDHPITEADLRQFRNEQGQRLEEVVDFQPE